ncbi:MAG: hypothetical protein ABW036_13335 [Flavitalea sp.]
MKKNEIDETRTCRFNLPVTYAPEDASDEELLAMLMRKEFVSTFPAVSLW